MLSIIKDMERIGDIIHRNMIPIIDKKHAPEIHTQREPKWSLCTASYNYGRNFLRSYSKPKPY